MATRLLDTNIVSYVLKGHSIAARYRPHLAGHIPAAAFMTVAELYEGAMRAGWGAARWTSLHTLLGRMAILNSSDTACHHFAAIRAMRRSRPISVADAWIAATALAHGIELVTHNPVDFQGVAGLQVITEAP